MSEAETITVRSGDFSVKIPKKYEVVVHDIYSEQKRFFDSPPPEVQELLAKFPNKPDIERFKGFCSHEIKLGEHSLIFHTERSRLAPDDLEFFIESQTKKRPQLQDYNVRDIRGKMVDSRIWWLKKGECMICFALQGRRELSEDATSDVEAILRSVEFSPDCKT